MTLLLSLLTRDYVLQASDRRVTQGAKLRDDESVKAVLLNGHTAFAFTGIARLPASEKARAVRGVEAGYRDTSQWLAEVVSCGATTLGEVLEDIQAEAAAAVSRVPYPLRDCALAFVGVGWEGTPLEPVLYQVWNFSDGKVAKGFEIATGRFEGNEPPYADHSSRPLPRKIAKDHQRRLRDCAERGLGPSATARVLVETIREVARQDRSVGRGIIQVCIPRRPVVELEAGREWLMSAHAPNDEHVTFQFFPPGEDTGKPHSPFMVLGGLITPTLILGDNVLKLQTDHQAEHDR